MAKQSTLGGDVKVGGEEIEAVPDNEDLEILGWTAISTIGNDFVVPRDWLEATANDAGLDPELLPPETSRKRAYNRALSRLCDRPRSWDEKVDDIEVGLHEEAHDEYHIEVTDRRDDDVTTEKLGAIVFDYDKDPSKPVVRPGHPNPEKRCVYDLSDGTKWYKLWMDYVRAFGAEYDEMRASNLGRDLRAALTGWFTEESRSVKLRNGGAVYFAPITAEETVRAWKDLIEAAGEEHKSAREGYRTEVSLMKVQNAEEERETIERRAVQEIREDIEDLVEDAIEELDEGALVDELVGELGSEVDELDDFASEYNVLLDAEITIERYLNEWKDELEGDAEELIERVEGRLDG